MSLEDFEQWKRKKSDDGPHFEDKHTLIAKGVEDTKNVGPTDENRVREE